MSERIEKRVEKLQVMAADSEIASIDDWRFANRVGSRSAAIRSLIYLGLTFSEADPERAREALNSLSRA